MPRTVQAMHWAGRPVPFMGTCLRRYGDMFTVRLPEAAGGTFVFVTKPDDVKTVFRAEPAVVHAGDGNKMLEPVLGPNSILVLDEGEHLRQRKLMLPAFHGEKIKAYDETIEEIAEREIARWPVGTELAAHTTMQTITLEVIMRTVFGFAASRVPELWDRFSDLLDLNSGRMLMLMYPAARNTIGAIAWRRLLGTLDSIYADLQQEVDRRRRENGDGQNGDILSLLVAAREEDGTPMTDAELRDELISLLIVGHESTATALSWAIERLVRHPRAYQRLTETLADGDDSYLEAVCKETLRTRTVVPLVARKLTAPLEVGDALLPAGVIAAPCIHLLHRRADVYPEPEEFRPERWLEDEIPAHAWVPFASGMRRCLGASFAMHEMKAVLRVLISQVELETTDAPDEPIMRRTVVFAPKQGARITVKGFRSKPSATRAATAVPR